MRTLMGCCVCLLLTGVAAAANRDGAPPPEVCRTMPAEPVPAQIMVASFFESHPDLYWRARGLEALKRENYQRALYYFQRSARYADKFSQSMVARLHWEGLGTPMDRALGYAWMDLAAERAYHDFLRQRELYWSQLAETERDQAIERGQAVYAQYRDRVAKPRMERALRRATDNITGSRTGFISSGLTIQTEYGAIPGQIFYDRRYYRADHYWCTQDAYWSRPLNPEVEVGAPTTVEQPTPRLP